MAEATETSAKYQKLAAEYSKVNLIAFVYLFTANEKNLVYYCAEKGWLFVPPYQREKGVLFRRGRRLLIRRQQPVLLNRRRRWLWGLCEQDYEPVWFSLGASLWINFSTKFAQFENI